jgi:hypothetical protein
MIISIYITEPATTSERFLHVHIYGSPEIYLSQLLQSTTSNVSETGDEDHFWFLHRSNVHTGEQSHILPQNEEEKSWS